jgi:hypothetical protein
MEQLTGNENAMSRMIFALCMILKVKPAKLMALMMDQEKQCEFAKSMLDETNSSLMKALDKEIKKIKKK